MSDLNREMTALVANSSQERQRANLRQNERELWQVRMDWPRHCAAALIGHRLPDEQVRRAVDGLWTV